MHYKNGREAKAGDTVVFLDKYNPTIGIVHSISASSDTCNARLAPVSSNNPYVTLKECLHIDDVALAPKPQVDSAPVPQATA